MSWRLDHSIQAMAEFCPNFAYQVLPPAAGGGGQWSGTIKSAVSAGQRIELLDDIHHNRPVFAVANGQLLHLASCNVHHCHHSWMDKVGDLCVPFKVSIHYAGGRAHPRCWVLSPHIPIERCRHMWDDGSICPFLASEDAWVWDRDTVADFIPYVSIWLVSWMVFERSGDWIVGEHEGTPEYHLDVVKPRDQCWCRSGRKYSKCHLHLDERLAAARRVRGLTT